MSVRSVDAIRYPASGGLRSLRNVFGSSPALGSRRRRGWYPIPIRSLLRQPRGRHRHCETRPARCNQPRPGGKWASPRFQPRPEHRNHTTSLERLSKENRRWRSFVGWACVLDRVPRLSCAVSRRGECVCRRSLRRRIFNKSPLAAALETSMNLINTRRIAPKLVLAAQVTAQRSQYLRTRDR
jgi:hypothetical protein